MSSQVDALNEMLAKLGFVLTGEYTREDLDLEHVEKCMEGRFISSCGCVAEVDTVILEAPENSIIAIMLELGIVAGVEPKPDIKECRILIEVTAEDDVGRKTVIRDYIRACPEAIL